MEDAFALLCHYCRKVEYRGWDLFDGLNSRFFLKSCLYKSPLIRLAWIQLFKRSPINFRKPALVPKDFNAKGLGLFASGFLALGKIEEAETLLAQLKVMICDGFAGVSWGYNFPWQARAFYVPVGTPNIVTTVFVVNAFLDYFERTRDEEALNITKASCEFILENLILFEDEDTLCFGYIPGEKARVHNANMLGAALLARVYSNTKDKVLLEKSRKAMAYSVEALTEDCFWPYGELRHHQFIDNFHTGFNLVALKNWMNFTGDQFWEDKLEGAYRQFLNNFWLENGCPKYYHNALYPIDIHCSAQGIVTCLKLARYSDQSITMAKKIALWAIANMQDNQGYFYYQKKRWYINKIPYIRWSQAWMFYAMSLLLAHSSAQDEFGDGMSGMFGD